MRVLGYFGVFGTLVGLTAAELQIISLKLLPVNYTASTLIGLAGFKALLIALFFQHLKDEPRPLSYVLLVGLVIAMLLLTISFLQLHQVHF